VGDNENQLEYAEREANHVRSLTRSAQSAIITYLDANGHVSHTIFHILLIGKVRLTLRIAHGLEMKVLMKEFAKYWTKQ
jgi:hypothetical protein